MEKYDEGLTTNHTKMEEESYRIIPKTSIYDGTISQKSDKKHKDDDGKESSNPLITHRTKLFDHDDSDATKKGRPSSATDVEDQEDSIPAPGETGGSVAPDGGWGWAVLVGCIYVTMLTTSTTTCFSLLFGRKMKDIGMSVTTISWIFNLDSFMFNTAFIFSGPLTFKFGWRRVAFPAACVMAFAYLLLSFATSSVHFFVLFSIIVGSSSGVSYSITMFILPAYFEKHRGLATCLNATAVGVSQMAMPQIIRLLQENMGILGSTIIYSGLMLNCCVSAALFRSIYGKQSKQRVRKYYNVDSKVTEIKTVNQPSMNVLLFTARHQSISNLPNIEIQNETASKQSVFMEILSEMKVKIITCLHSLTSFKLVILAIGFGLYIIGYYNFTMMIPFVVMEAQYTYEFASYCLSTNAVTNTLTRVLMAVLSDRSWFSVTAAFFSGSIVSAAFCIMFALSLSNKWLILTSMIGYGVGIGLTMSLWSMVVIEYVGIDEYIHALGASGLVIASLFLIAGPLFGAVRDASATFYWSVALAAGLQLMLALLGLLMRLARRRSQQRVLRNNDKNRTEQIL